MRILKLHFVWVIIVSFFCYLLSLIKNLKIALEVWKCGSFSSTLKKFWDFFRKNRFSYDISRNISFNDLTGPTAPESVNLFASYFCSVYLFSLIDTNFRSLCIHSFDLPNIAFLSAANMLLKLYSLHDLSIYHPGGIPSNFLFNLRHYRIPFTVPFLVFTWLWYISWLMKDRLLRLTSSQKFIQYH